MSIAVAEPQVTAFASFQRIATGPRDHVIALLRARSHEAPALVFDDDTGDPLDLDLRSDVHPAIDPPQAALDAQPARGVGRPKLGVVAREVTLLPRHWDWLGRQPGGASVALRRLVDEARRMHVERDATRAAREATYRFMTAIAGDLPGFEDATRALFAGDRGRFDTLTDPWPGDLPAHLKKLSSSAWAVA